MIGIERFMVHQVKVQRKLRQGPEGPVFDTEDASLRGRIKIKNQLVRSADGREVTSVATVQVPVDTAAVPSGSKVTLPARFSSRTLKVIAEGVSDSGLPNLPAFYQMFLE